uniref:Uncharacterized protein n=1 Tax=Arundo donax TaxID=35708 RepID=A0A0A9F6F2_ARUDO
MLNMTFRKYHMKKKKPVTSAGYLSRKPAGLASPAGSEAAAAGGRSACLLLACDESRAAGRSAGRSWRPQTSLTGGSCGDASGARARLAQRRRRRRPAPPESVPSADIAGLPAWGVVLEACGDAKWRGQGRKGFG